jgi:hypothetical protein
VRVARPLYGDRPAVPRRRSVTDISGTWSPPAASVRLRESRNVAITSYNGTHGTIRGPWPTDMYVAAPVIIVRVTSIDHLEQLPDLQRPGEGTS